MIGKQEAREADPAWQRPAGEDVRRRRRRAYLLMGVIQVATTTLVGLVLAGYPGVLFFLAFGLVSTLASIWLARPSGS